MSDSETYKPVIVVPAYKREKSLRRLLHSINEANYTFDDIQLIISIEGNAKHDIVDLAENFRFKAGSVQIIKREKQLGLYKHILSCGDLTREFGTVLILEDDLVVSPAYYEFASRALSFYDECDKISGIALYSQRFNETATLPFEPMQEKWPVYFMQLGCSWGQAWTHKQWNEFKEWLSENREERPFNKPEIPKNVKNWSESSWKKHYNHFLVEHNKYIVYPYNSFSTNCADSGGSHIKVATNNFQVPLNLSNELGSHFQFPLFSENSIRYDCFMESRCKIIEKWVGVPLDELEMDLYGCKPVKLLRKKKYTITSKQGDNPIKSYPSSFRPIELNLKYNAKMGSDSFFKMYESDDVVDSDSITPSRYYQLAQYFLYLPIQSRKFAITYFKDLTRKYWNRCINYFG